MKTEKQLTAVEWLEKISNKGSVTNSYFNELLEQAKAMEKEQISDAQSYAISNADNDNGYFDCEQYYNETFKSE